MTSTSVAVLSLEPDGLEPLAGPRVLVDALLARIPDDRDVAGSGAT
jgi:hypothetical protein